MTDPASTPSAIPDHFRSVDSTPAAYAHKRPASVANGFLVNFTAASITALLGLVVVLNADAAGHSRDIVVVSGGGERAAIPVRTFVTVFFLVFAWSVASNRWRRAVIGAQLLGTFAVIVVAIDLAAATLDLAGVTTPVVGQQIVSGVIAMITFPIVVIRNAHLPAPVRAPLTGHIRWHSWLRALMPLILAFLIAAAVEVLAGDLAKQLRDLALMGGIGPGAFLVQQLFAAMTATIGILIIRRSRRHTFAPPVAILVPAHNEAHLIAATIGAVDRAAASYDGTARLYVVDNASTDHTTELAEAAIRSCDHLTGQVLSCTTPGKAIALNYGLQHIAEPFVVRIDADTVIGERCLTYALRHFADPEIGAVGGLPLPTTNETFFDRARLVEVLVRHGFFQIALLGYDGVLGLPGMFVAYRKEALDRAGAIVQGMNGEDTDICLRMSAAGYRNFTDPAAVYHSETPRSWAHMREQRTRWFRSIYHLAGHNRHTIFGRNTMAGAVVLPLQLANAARRAMLAPMLIYAFLVLVAFHSVLPSLRWQPIVATVVGLPALMAIAICLLHRRWRAVLYVPEYLAFRVIRSYFTLAAVLSLVYPPLQPFSGRRLRSADRAGEIPARR